MIFMIDEDDQDIAWSIAPQSWNMIAGNGHRVWREMQIVRQVHR